MKHENSREDDVADDDADIRSSKLQICNMVNFSNKLLGVMVIDRPTILTHGGGGGVFMEKASII